MSVRVERRRALVFALSLAAAAMAAQATRPRRRADLGRTRLSLETVFPRGFALWRPDETQQAFVQPPEVQGKLYGFYDQVLERAYVGPSGERIMLCAAYGSEQSPALQVHRPEVCYEAGGFHIDGKHAGLLDLDGRKLPVTRLHAKMVGRSEPVTYWIVLGDSIVSDSDSFRWRQLSASLRGEVRDGMLMRVSSIERDPEAGYRLHRRFVTDLSRALLPGHRDRVFGSVAGR